MARMRGKHDNLIPDPGEKFSYVIVRSEPLYKYGGEKKTKLTYAKYNYAEFVNVAKAENKAVDIKEYMNDVVALCARFSSANSKYWPPADHKIMQLGDLDEREK